MKLVEANKTDKERNRTIDHKTFEYDLFPFRSEQQKWVNLTEDRETRRIDGTTSKFKSAVGKYFAFARMVS